MKTNLAKKIEKQIIKIKNGQEPKERGCVVCRSGWKAYHGDYDALCTKHYLRVEPTG